MEKEFIPYTLALELKSLGFDEPCFGRYYYKESYPMLNPRSKETELVFELGQYLKQTEVTILAPTFSQAFRCFREKYNLFSVCFPQLDIWVIEIKQLGGMEGNPVIQGYPDLEYNTYEQAELACLKKLIEIIKTKQNG